VDLAAADVHVVGERVRELGSDRPHLPAHPAEVVQQFRALPRQLGQELGEPEDVYGSIIVNAIPPYSAARAEVVRLPGGGTEPDELAVEEPLEIRVGGRPVAVTMRTPGHDDELALGFLVSEGVRPLDVSFPDDLAANTVDVRAEGFDPERLSRHFYTSSSCGVCGKGALEAVAVESPRVESDLKVPAELVGDLPERLREAQPAFAATGGLHATGLFDGEGALLCVREDVGRHNAMDKVIGWAFVGGRLPLSREILCVSGRLSFELVQKAAVAGCPVMVAVGAPSTLAVELARDRGITLCGFVRGGRINVYSEPQRIA
jgi:FdhD protein